MDAMPIGRAAAQLGLAPSALRYYDARGLVRPAGRLGGRRMYGRAQLRRLALVKMAGELGLSLETAAAVLDAPSSHWRTAVQEQIAVLDAAIARARGARSFLNHALDCPAEHPAEECSALIATLDRLVDGVSVSLVAAEHADQEREGGGGGGI